MRASIVGFLWHSESISVFIVWGFINLFPFSIIYILQLNLALGALVWVQEPPYTLQLVILKENLGMVAHTLSI